MEMNGINGFVTNANQALSEWKKTESTTVMNAQKDAISVTNWANANPVSTLTTS